MHAQADFEDVDYVCPDCQVGTFHLRPVVFAHWFEDQFILIPDFPGWVCDFCSAREYDAEALTRLETVLGPEAELRREASRRGRRGARFLKSGPHPNRRYRV